MGNNPKHKIITVFRKEVIPTFEMLININIYLCQFSVLFCYKCLLLHTGGN